MALDLGRDDHVGLPQKLEPIRGDFAENSDRERMFKEIAAATGTDLSQLSSIKKTYAQTLRQKARRGDWIELPDGTWKQKA